MMSKKEFDLLTDMASAMLTLLSLATATNEVVEAKHSIAAALEAAENEHEAST